MLLSERTREMGIMIVTDVVTSAGAESDEGAVGVARDGRELMSLGEVRSSETPDELGERNAFGPGAGSQRAVLVRLKVDHRLGLHSLMTS
jgi:hypothetical protein